MNISINLKDKKVLIVGAGSIALRKLRGLMHQGADIHIVAPDIHPEIRQIAAVYPEVRILEAEFWPGHVLGALLVFCCTDKPEVNYAAAAAARKNGIMVNRCDKADDWDFHSTAGFDYKDFRISVSSKNGSKVKDSLAIRDQLQHFLESRQR